MNPHDLSACVHVVDDDAAIREALAWLLEAEELPCRCHPSAEAFLASVPEAGQINGCLLLDIRMDGMSGLQLFDHLKADGLRAPVIFLTGHGDVPMAVAALKQGAHDFLEKPWSNDELCRKLREALALDAARTQALRQTTDAQQALQQLSERERAVMDRVLAGKLNKQIADELCISMRTVEVHRARLFEKMGVKSAVELAQRLGRLHTRGA